MQGRALKPLVELISLKGKKSLVTGSASGIGRAIAVRLAEAGSDLYLVDIDEGSLRELREEIRGSYGVDAEVFRVDL